MEVFMNRVVGLCPIAVFALAFTSASATTTDHSVSVTAPDLVAGDSWVYDDTHERGTTGYSQQRVDLAIQRVGNDTMIVGIKPDGAPINFENHIVGLDWSNRLIVDGKEIITGRPLAFPLTKGKTWVSESKDSEQRGRQTYTHWRRSYKVIGWEDVKVPAGTFHALKIQSESTGDAWVAPITTMTNAVAATAGDSTSISHTHASRATLVHVIEYSDFYYAPEVKYFVKTVDEQYNSDNVMTGRNTRALVSYKVQATAKPE
jgi:hypothetical protein